MVDFMTAIKWMKEGKKVTRRYWGEDIAINIPNSTLICYYSCNENKPKAMDIDNIEAIDWQIYKETYEEHIKHCDFCESFNHEDKDWTLTDNPEPYSDKLFHANTIRLLIRIVKDSEDEKELINTDDDSIIYNQGFKKGMNYITKELDKRLGSL